MKQPGFSTYKRALQSWRDAIHWWSLSRAIPWDSFRGFIEQLHTQERKSNAGRPSWDAVLMYEGVLVIGDAVTNLSMISWSIRS